MTFKTKLSDISTLSFLGFNQHSIVYPSGWDGYIADVDMETVKFIYDEDNVNYITKYTIEGKVYYFDDLIRYQFVGDTLIYVTKVRNSFSLTIDYIDGQEKIDGLVGKQSLQCALNRLSQEALATVNAIFEDDRLFVDYEKSERISVDDFLSQIMQSDLFVYSEWQRPTSPTPALDEVDYSDCHFVNTWSALFANDFDVLASELMLTADGLYMYQTYINGKLSANISGVYRIENGKVQLKTMKLNYQYQLVDKDDLKIDITFAQDGLLSASFIYLQDMTSIVFEHTMTCKNIRPVNYTNKEFLGSYDFNGANIELRGNGTAEISYNGNSIIAVYRVTDDGKLYIFDNGEIGTGEIKGVLEVK